MISVSGEQARRFCLCSTERERERLVSGCKHLLMGVCCESWRVATGLTLPAVNYFVVPFFFFFLLEWNIVVLFSSSSSYWNGISFLI